MASSSGYEMSKRLSDRMSWREEWQPTTKHKRWTEGDDRWLRSRKRDKEDNMFIKCVCQQVHAVKGYEDKESITNNKMRAGGGRDGDGTDREESEEIKSNRGDLGSQQVMMKL